MSLFVPMHMCNHVDNISRKVRQGFHMLPHKTRIGGLQMSSPDMGLQDLQGRLQTYLNSATIADMK